MNLTARLQALRQAGGEEPSCNLDNVSNVEAAGIHTTSLPRVTEFKGGVEGKNMRPPDVAEVAKVARDDREVASPDSAPDTDTDHPFVSDTWHDTTPERSEANFGARWGMSPDEWWTSYAGEIGAVVPWIRDNEGDQ